MILSSHRISFLAPYFVEIQHKSFLNLLDNGLIFELLKRMPISDQKLHLIFYPEFYQLSPPEYTPKQAIFKAKTYGSKLYVPLQVINKKNKQFQLQWVLIGHLPLMTKRGHFIVNGSPRVIVSQLIRSPGIYYRETIDYRQRKTYYADLISNRGAWLRIKTDVKHNMWILMKKAPKIPILIFLMAVGITEHMIDIQMIEEYQWYLRHSIDLDKFPYPEGYEHALSIIQDTIYPRNLNADIIHIKNLLNRKFFNHKTYDLSKLGRIQLNKKLQFFVLSSTSILRPYDLLIAVEYLIKLQYGLGKIDDIDHLKNRRVRTSGELLQNQLGTGFIRLDQFIREKIKKPKLSIRNIISTTPVNGALREFFGSSPLSQFMDETNPLAELTHKRRVSSLGPGGVSRENAGMDVRGIHPTYYGRICPIETPEGPNAGLVNSLTIFATINTHGFLQTPFYSVYRGQIQKNRGITFISAAQEENIISAPADLKTDYFSNLPLNNIPVRDNGEFKKLSRNRVKYIPTSPIQMISIATSLIPFLEHDDANRALMGSNMQRQALPLILPEKSIVRTALEARVISDSGHGIQARQSGFVSYASNQNIQIEQFTQTSAWSNLKKTKTIRITNLSHKQNCQLPNPYLSPGLSVSEADRLTGAGLSVGCLTKTTNIPDKKLLSSVQSKLKKKNLKNPPSNLKVPVKRSDQKNMPGSLAIALSTHLSPAQLRQAIRKSPKILSRVIYSRPNVNQPWETSKIGKQVSQQKPVVNQPTVACDQSKNLNSHLEKLGKKSVGQLTKHKQTKKKGWQANPEFFHKKYGSNKKTTQLNSLSKKIEKNFSVLKEIVFNSQLSLFQKILSNNLNTAETHLTWLGFNKVNYLQFTSIFAPYFLNSDSLEKFETSSCFAIQLKKKLIQQKKSSFNLIHLINRLRLKLQLNPNFTKNLALVRSKKKIKTSSKKIKTSSKKVNSIKHKFRLPKYWITLPNNKVKTALNYSDTNFFNFTRSSFFIGPLPSLSVSEADRLTTPNRGCQSVMEVDRLARQIKKNSNLNADQQFVKVKTKKKGKSVDLSSKKALSLSVASFAQEKLNREKYISKVHFRNVSNFNFNTASNISNTNLKLNKKSFLKIRHLISTHAQKPLKQMFVYESHDFSSLSSFSNRNYKLSVRNFTNIVWNDPSKKQFIAKKHTYNFSFVRTKFLKKKNSTMNFSSIKKKDSFTQYTNSSLLPSKTFKSTSQIQNDSVSGYSKNLTSDYLVQPYHRSNQNTCIKQRPIVHEGDWVQKGDLIADGAASVNGELALGKTLLVAYMPWEGYNFEDAIVINQRLIYDDLYTSIHIERYQVEIADTEYGLEIITSHIPKISNYQKSNLDKDGIIRVGSWIYPGDILVGKLTPIKPEPLTGYNRLLADILLEERTRTYRESSLRVPKNLVGRVIHIEVLPVENIPAQKLVEGPGKVHIYIAEKKKIQIGDKMSGRHGNKGIISKILPREDMPYLPDGTAVDIVLNPLGVPSRMNVGQIFECILGLAGKQLNEQFKIHCFDETNGPEASRSFTYSKLFEARLKTGKNWLFNPNHPGKTQLFDGRTGECFQQTVTIGQAYMFKLAHLVDDKIHARSTGPYSLVTQQPLRGRSKHGGQRLGEMEVWALQGYGAAFTLQELLTNKSDDIKARKQVMQAILYNQDITLGRPESFKVLVAELQALCLNIGIYTVNKSGIRTRMPILEPS